MSLSFFLGIMAGAFWGLSFVLPIYLTDIPALWISFGRFTMLGLASLIYLMIKSQKPVLNRRYLFLGASGNSVYYFLLILSLERLGVTLPTLIIGLLPLTTFLFGAEKDFHSIRLKDSWWGILLVLLGIFLSTVDNFSIQRFSLLGMVSCLMSLVLWTYYSTQNSRQIKLHPEVNAFEWTSQTGVSSAVIAGGMIVLGFMFDSDLMITQWKDLVLPKLGLYLWVCFVLGVGGGWVAFILWNLASQKLPAQINGQLIVSETVFGIFYGLILEHRFPRTLEAAAIICLVLGVLALVQLWRRRGSPG
jgi:drug/metabolite transporter (DMT)-like permease